MHTSRLALHRRRELAHGLDIDLSAVNATKLNLFLAGYQYPLSIRNASVLTDPDVVETSGARVATLQDEVEAARTVPTHRPRVPKAQTATKIAPAGIHHAESPEGQAILEAVQEQLFDVLPKPTERQRRSRSRDTD